MPRMGRPRHVRSSMCSNGSLEYKTTLGFNKDQHLHRNTTCLEHPECPSRIDECRNLLRESGLLQACQEVDDFPTLDDLDLRQSHSEEHVNRLLKEAISLNQEALNRLCEGYDSVFMTPDSVKVAQSAVSCSRWLAESIVEEKIPNAFALIRPPGHHAGRSSACGFCLFNNAAQAAEAAFNFGADRVLVFSIHRYQAGKFWPHLRESNYDHIGIYEGKGYNINIPLNEVDCGDADYMAIFWNVLWPLASQFNPDFVIVSAGYDSCDGDPLGGMRLSPDAYSHFIYHLGALASGKLLAILEGGYNHRVAAVGVHRCVRVLCGYKPFPLEILEPPRARHQPTIVFHLPDSDELNNTGAVKQESLVHPEYQCEETVAVTKTLIVHNGDTAMHFSSAETDHPERPERTVQSFLGNTTLGFYDIALLSELRPQIPIEIIAIMNELEKRGLISKCDVVENSRFATDEELEAVHERPYIRRMKSTAEMSEGELRVTENGVNSIFLTHETFHVASKAAGAVLEILVSAPQSAMPEI
ncbi:histone deacetylase family protein, partial [Teladorsagia circumcincta]